jgi:hypothetical protein
MVRKMLIHALIAALLVGSAAAVYAEVAGPAFASGEDD